MQELFPDVKFAIGPPIDDGFYYDFEVEKPFTPEDLARIEARCNELLKSNLPITREVWDKARARDYFGKLGQRYKLELIDEIPGDTVSIYTVGRFVDLCAGPHIDIGQAHQAREALLDRGCVLARRLASSPCCSASTPPPSSRRAISTPT